MSLRKNKESEQDFTNNFPNPEQDKQNTFDALREGDWGSLLRIGFERFIRNLFNNPILFHTFLTHTGNFIDEMILDICKQEALNYVGGKLTMHLEKHNTVSLSADLYFQNTAEQWVLKKREGSISADRFKDWNTASELITLQKEKVLEIPIDPPLEV